LSALATVVYYACKFAQFVTIQLKVISLFLGISYSNMFNNANKRTPRKSCIKIDTTVTTPAVFLGYYN